MMDIRETKLTDQDLWEVAQSFIKEQGLVQHHIRSYNRFIHAGLQELVNSLSDHTIITKHGTVVLKFGAVEIDPPRVVEIDGTSREIMPSEARLRDLNYAAPLSVRMSLYLDGRLISTEKVEVGIVPVMVRSDLCPLSKMSDDELVRVGEDPLDPGGYFIINGSERAIVAMEDLAPNRIMVTEKSSSSGINYACAVLSAAHGRQSRVEARYKPDNPVKVFFSRIYKGIPAIVMLRALGMTSDKDITSLISSRTEIQEMLEPSFTEAEGIDTVEDAIVFIGNRIAFGYAEEYRAQRAEQLIDLVFLPHIGSSKATRYAKAVFLCEMISRVLETSAGLREPSDRDHYASKRLKLAGPLMEQLYRMAFLKLIRDIRYHLERVVTQRQQISVSTFVRPGIITSVVRRSFATGNWTGGRVGVTQLLNRINYLSTLSHLRRVQSPLSRSQPHFEARDLHGTHWGRLCPNETPEGANCGLVKNLALSAEFSSQADVRDLVDKLMALGVTPFSESSEIQKGAQGKVFVDGQLIGYHPRVNELVSQIRSVRRSGEISKDVNVALYEFPSGREAWVCADEGRVRRPLIVVEKVEPKLRKNHIQLLRNGAMKFSDLVSLGVIELLDAEEEENAQVAITLDDIDGETTHLEIAPYMMLGLVVANIPFAEHNQSPRNSYEGAMAKQALGVFSTNYSLRTDSRFHVLEYPQAPLTNTRLTELAAMNSRPIGQNMLVAVLSHQGYNMEDAIVINKSAVERGLALSTAYRTYEVESRHYLGGQKDRFEIPDPTIRGYRGEQYYRLIDKDGFSHVEVEAAGGNVLVGMVSPPRFMEEYQRYPTRAPIWRDTSEAVRPSESGVVNSVYITRTDEGNKLVKIKVRSHCFPEMGDKFSSRHGQKGVIGMLVPQEDMPYTENGIVPDLIINPHAFPSRMTVGQLIESISSKVASITGQFVDGTPFAGADPKSIQQQLQRLGFSHSGKEVLYDGATGKEYETDVFIGPVYYHRLHHLVRDKIHARARGQVQMLTRQPTEGRSRGGGLKFGEMERDCLVAYGASALLMDRLLEQSDKYVTFFCEKCGFPAYYDLKQERYVCRICDKDASVRPVTLSYAFYLLLNEMMSMGISTKFLFEEAY